MCCKKVANPIDYPGFPWAEATAENLDGESESMSTITTTTVGQSPTNWETSAMGRGVTDGGSGRRGAWGEGTGSGQGGFRWWQTMGLSRCSAIGFTV